MRAGELDWSVHFVDGTVIRAHQSAAGAVGGQEHEALGRSRGGFSTKLHLRAEGGGKPIAFHPPLSFRWFVNTIPGVNFATQTALHQVTVLSWESLLDPGGNDGKEP